MVHFMRPERHVPAELSLEPATTADGLTTVVSIRRAAHVLAGIVAFFAVMHVIVWILAIPLHKPELYGFVDQFDLNKESNLPSFFSAVQLLTIGLVLALIWRGKRAAGSSYARRWGLMSVVFVYLSLDEAASIHEMSSNLLKNRVPDLHGALQFAWVVPGMIAVVALGLYMIPFLRFELPAGTRNRLILAAALFLVGAVGMEILEGIYSDGHGEHNLPMAAMFLVEETLEMGAMSFFLITMLTYLRDQVGTKAALELVD